MPFGFFKKKKKEEPIHYDPTNINVLDIRKGFVFDYDDDTWEATEEYEYDWGDNRFTYEFKIVSAAATRYLYVENDDEVEAMITDKIQFSRLDDSIERAIHSNGKPPKEIKFNGMTFYRDSENPGFFRNLDSTEWRELISWTYYDAEEDNVLVIEQWGDHEFEASIGVSEDANAFSNILPGQSS